MYWSDEKALQLIDAYRQRPVLWDPTDEHFSLRLEKDDAWREISDEMNAPVDECKRKLSTMKAGYRREKAKSQSRTIRKQKQYVSQWFAFDAFRFLDTRKIPERRYSKQIYDSETEVAVVHLNDGTDEDVVEVEVPTPVQRVRQSTATSSQHRSPSTFSKRHKKPSDTSSILETVLELVKDKSVNPDRDTPQANETDAFFTYVTTKANSYSELVKKRVQHAIFDVLLKADTGFYDSPGSNDCGPACGPFLLPQRKSIGASMKAEK